MKPRPSAAGIRLVARMSGWACALPVLKRVLPLPRLAALMWLDGHGEVRRGDVERIARTASALARLRPLPARDNCLERSLLAYRYLSAAGALPRLVVAVRGNEALIEGHVWVTLDDTPLFPEDVTTFDPVLEFGEGGRRYEPARA